MTANMAEATERFEVHSSQGMHAVVDTQANDGNGSVLCDCACEADARDFCTLLNDPTGLGPDIGIDGEVEVPELFPRDRNRNRG